MGIRHAVAAVVLLALLLPGCMVLEGGRKPHRVPEGHDGSFTVWWDEEVIKEQGDYKAGARHGWVETFHASGGLASAGEYSEGLPVGELRHYHPEGSLAVSEIIQAGTLNGPRIVYWPDGSVRASIEYLDGLKHGVEIQHAEGGSVLLEGSWSRGLKSGRWQYRDPSGRLLSEERFWIADGRPAGYLETVYDGPDASVQTLLVNRTEDWRGWVTLWHDNGRQSSLVEYVDDQREGRDVSWNAGGQVVSEGHRIADERVGSWRFWDQGVLREVDYTATEAAASSESGAVSDAEAVSAADDGTFADAN